MESRMEVQQAGVDKKSGYYCVSDDGNCDVADKEEKKVEPY